MKHRLNEIEHEIHCEQIKYFIGINKKRKNDDFEEFCELFILLNISRKQNWEFCQIVSVKVN